jgi:hypothetical protein
MREGTLERDEDSAAGAERLRGVRFPIPREDFLSSGWVRIAVFTLSERRFFPFERVRTGAEEKGPF